MLTTNYNVVQVSLLEKEKYNVGDIFNVPYSSRNNFRHMKFNGLKIKEITFGFGIFLHFDWNEWENHKPNPIPYKKVNKQ